MSWGDFSPKAAWRWTDGVSDRDDTSFWKVVPGYERSRIRLDCSLASVLLQPRAGSLATLNLVMPLINIYTVYTNHTSSLLQKQNRQQACTSCPSVSCKMSSPRCSGNGWKIQACTVFAVWTRRPPGTMCLSLSRQRHVSGHAAENWISASNLSR